MTSIDGTCGWVCGGYNYHFSGITFVGGSDHIGECCLTASVCAPTTIFTNNSGLYIPANFRWAYDGIFVDLDGSLTGSDDETKVLPWTDTLDPIKCSKDDRFSAGAVQGAVCDASMDFGRISFNS